MRTKSSRYRKTPDVAARDARGTVFTSKTVRSPADTEGSFLHTIEESDRLDHLAYKYYKEPTKWWRICDANPSFLSPQGLIGKEPLVVSRIPLVFEMPATPVWNDLSGLLRGQVGVEKVDIVEEALLDETRTNVDGEVIVAATERFEHAVIIVHNRMNIGTEALKALMEAHGFRPGTPTEIGRVGKAIIIPPNTVG